MDRQAVNRFEWTNEVLQEEKFSPATKKVAVVQIADEQAIKSDQRQFLSIFRYRRPVFKIPYRTRDLRRKQSMT